MRLSGCTGAKSTYLGMSDVADSQNALLPVAILRLNQGKILNAQSPCEAQLKTKQLKHNDVSYTKYSLLI